MPDRPLDPDPESMRRLGYRAVDLAVDWLAGLSDAPVARMPRADVLAPLVDEPLPTGSRPVEASMERFVHDFLPYATLVNHPRFFAYIPCPGSYIGALGSFLAASTNLFTGSWLGGAVAAQLEAQVVDWIRQAIDAPAGFAGALTSGGSMANLSALAAARTRIPITGRDLARIYLGTEAHHSIQKSARLLGFAEDATRILDPFTPDALDRAMREDEERGAAPMLVAATLGTTTTGSIDPLDAIADVCERHDVWYHVDGAYGAAVALLPEWRDRIVGLRRADSITLDPHKWLYSPFECGCFLTRHLDALREAFATSGEYMQDIPRDEINFFERGPELSRGNRALKLWLLLRSVGVEAIADAIRKDLRLAALARDLLDEDPRIHIHGEPELSVVCFTIDGGEAAGARLMHDILEDGFLMLSTSRVAGTHVLRMCVLNHRTTEEDVRASVGRIRELIR